MKKFFCLTFLCVILGLFASCEKSDEVSNPLVGTLWSFDDESVFGEFTRYIEFIDNKNVKMWDDDGHGPYFGTYSIDGSNITFSNIHNTYWDFYYVNGTYTSKSLTIYCKSGVLGHIYPDVYTKE